MQNKSGFTLVELSIVLIIIGLLIAGITAGSSLIKSATLSSVVSEFNRYKTASNNFISRYAQLPGDYNDTQHENWNLAYAACNGNNDGYIGSPSMMEGVLSIYELMMSKMVEGIGALQASPYQFLVLTSNCTLKYGYISPFLPSSKVANGLYSIVNGSNIIAMGALYPYTFYSGLWNASATELAEKNAILLGSSNNLTPELPNNSGVIDPLSAKSIDLKIDDGVPTTGALRGFDGTNSFAGVCLSAGNNGTTPNTAATYAIINNTNQGCGLAFAID